jgi:hypothetical protein
LHVSLLDEVLEGHGGAGRWRAAETIRARVRSGGLLLATRVPRRLFVEYELILRVGEPWAMFVPVAGAERAVFDRGRVRHETTDGELLGERDDPRSAFFGASGVRRNLRWDVLDTAYFAGYAMWNYLTTPLLLTRVEVEAREGEPLESDGERWRRLDARFGPGLDTHSARQSFYFDDRRLLRRHDYTAEVIGGWARAAHLCTGHREVDGLIFPTRRRVYPVLPGGRVSARPTLVSIDIGEVEVASE